MNSEKPWQFLIVVTTIAVVLLANAEHASGQSSGGEEGDPTTQPTDPTSDDTVSIGGSADSGIDQDSDIGSAQIVATYVQNVGLSPLTDGAGLGSDITAPQSDVVPASGGLDPNCIEQQLGEEIEPGVFASGYCITWLDCGFERVDDVVSGERAGSDATGRYREYLDQITSVLLTDTTGILADAGITDIGSVNDFLLTQGLADPPNNEHLPVFYWCAERDGNFVYEPVDIATAFFGWDTTFGETYDIPGSLTRLYGELAVQLDLYTPDIGLVPPAEQGFTFVQWPTWMFLNNPPADEHLYTTNDIDTLRIDLRAVLLGVDWHFGEELVASCATQDMVQFEEGTHHPIDNLPPCHHVFTQLARDDLTVTINFKIEQRIAGRLASLYPYPENLWTDFLGAPTVIDLTTTLPDYEVHPIASVVVRGDQTTQDIITNARAAGTLPNLDD